MTDPLLDAIAAVSDKSPAIKRALGLAAQRIIALEQVAPPPEPPAPPASTSRGGIGLLQLGQAVPSGAGRYDVVMTDESNVVAARQQQPPAGRTLVYMAAPDVASVGNYGVDYATAQANGWLLTDTAGKPLVNVGYPSNYIGDVGSDGYRAAWFDHVSGLLGKLQPSGVYIDDVLGDTQLLLGGGYPAKYPNRAAWQGAMAGFIAYVGRRLRALGWYVLVNANAYTPGDGNSDNGVLDQAWWKMIAPDVDGLMREYWQQNPNTVDQVMTSDASKGWLGQWTAWLALPSVARSLGCDFYTASYGSAATLAYIRASFLLQWDGKGGAVIAAGAGTPLDTTNLGAPLGAASVTGSVWTRSFERGKVTLDSLRGTATVTAG